jgi:flagellar hook assembly protein FlgD
LTFTATNSFTLTDTYTPSNTFTHTDTATPTNTPTDTATSTNTSTPTDTPTPLRIVNINKSASNTQPAPLDNLVYTIGIQVPDNSVSQVTLWDTVPAGLQFQSAPTPAEPPGGTLTVIALPTVGSTPGTGTLLVWTFPYILPGQYSLSYNASVNNYLAGGTVLTNQVDITTLEAPTPQSTQAPVTLTGGYTVRINVYNEAGEVVKTVLSGHYSMPILDFSLSLGTLRSIHDQTEILFQGVVLGTWDGMNNAGGEVTDGDYFIKVDNVSPLGTVTTETLTVVVDRHLAEVSVNVYNASGEVVRHLEQVVADAVTVSQSVSISGGTLDPSYQGGTDSAVTLTLADGSLLTWNGTSDNGNIVSNGQYFIEIQSNDGQGGNATVIKQVTVFHGGLNFSDSQVTVWPNPLYVSRGGQKVYFSVGTQVALRVKIYTMAGELAGQAQSQVSVPGVAVWDITAQTIASGLYIADIEMTNPNGAVERQMRKIAVIQ